jgi:hypothetical protein
MRNVWNMSEIEIRAGGAADVCFLALLSVRHDLNAPVQTRFTSGYFLTALCGAKSEFSKNFLTEMNLYQFVQRKRRTIKLAFHFEFRTWFRNEVSL